MYDLHKGLCIKYIGGGGGGGGEGGWKVFAEAMKYFKHILMGHEIFLKIFDGPQSIFLFTSFPIFLVASYKNLWWSEPKMIKLAIKGI